MTRDYITAAIIALGIANILVFLLVRLKNKQLDSIIHPKSNRRIGTQASMSIEKSEYDKLCKASDCAEFCYTLYTNITAIFPLLGIFGTVVSLMRLSGTDALSDSFSMALTTTMWGLICAMLFKLADSFISSKLDRLLDEADYLIHQHDEEKRRSYAPQAETEYRY